MAFSSALAVVGVVVVATIMAASTPTALEPETGTLAGGATVASVSGQSGVGAVKFAPPVTPTPTPIGGRTCPAFPAFPDASCTGVPSGHALATLASLDTTASGQAIDGKLITGDLNIGHNNVTVTNTRIKGHVILNGHTGLTLQDVDLGPDACPATGNGGSRALVGDSGYTLLRTHVHNNGDDLMSIGGGQPVLYQDSIVDQGCFYPADHLDAVQWYDPGGLGHITLIHNIINVQPANSSDKGNAALFFADGAASGTTVTAYNNKFGGGQVSTALYDAVKNSGIVIDLPDNVYIKNSYAVGPCSFGSSVKSIVFDGTSGVKYANNKFDDGTPVTCN